MYMAKDAARDNLAPGMLLAAPTLHDPNFEHSVVLLGRSGDDGALGWVINGRELMSVLELGIVRGVAARAPDPGDRLVRFACASGRPGGTCGWLAHLPPRTGTVAWRDGGWT